MKFAGRLVSTSEAKVPDTPPVAVKMVYCFSNLFHTVGGPT